MAKADYGIDAPGVVRNLLGGGLILTALSWGAPWLPLPRGLFAIALAFRPTGPCMVVCGLVMLWSSLIGKRRLCRRLIGFHRWTGEERVLDVGCGRGLALVEAAKRLNAGGHATGVDLWSAIDLSGNTPERTRANAEMEGIADRVTIDTSDARALPYPDASFDVVMSMTVIHNIPSPADRAKAIGEMARVLKPGGTMLLTDIRHVFAYPRVVCALGLRIEARAHPILWALPGILLVARKP